MGVLAPAGGKWSPTTLVGTAARQTGILRQTLYKGVITFNKMHFRKHPETGRRVSVPRPPSEWVQAPIPELAIVSEELFDHVQNLIAERSTARRQLIEQRQLEDAQAQAAREAERQRRWRRQQAKLPAKKMTVFSGRLRCGEHQTKIGALRTHLYGCPEPRCQHRNMPWDEVMPLCLEALGALSTETVASYYRSPAVAAEHAAYAAAAEAAAKAIGDLRDVVRKVVMSLGSAARTTTIREILDEHEQEIRRLTWQRIKAERRRDALAPPEAAVHQAIANYRKLLTQLRSAPADHKLSVRLRGCVERFDVGVDDLGRRRITAVFDVLKVMELGQE